MVLQEGESFAKFLKCKILILIEWEWHKCCRSRNWANPADQDLNRLALQVALHQLKAHWTFSQLPIGQLLSERYLNLPQLSLFVCFLYTAKKQSKSTQEFSKFNHTMKCNLCKVMKNIFDKVTLTAYYLIYLVKFTKRSSHMSWKLFWFICCCCHELIGLDGTFIKLSEMFKNVFLLENMNSWN